MNLGARLKTALQLAGLRAPEISRVTNVPVAAINALLRRDSRRSEYTERILSALPLDKVNHEWVRSGKGEPVPTGLGGLNGSRSARDRGAGAAVTQPHRSWEHPEKLPEGSYVALPRLHVERGPDGARGRRKVSIKLVKHDVLTFTTGWMRYDESRPAALAWAQASDDSMETVLYPGDYFVVDTEQTEVVDGRTYVIFYEGQERVRRLFRLPGGRLRIEANNSQLFPTLELSAADVKGVSIIGRVVHRSGPGGL
ncbi:LexA family transcriptional regulator [Variovorax sp. J22R115]|uniref:S24 family peptidase n=1 Tax=Variovorax sp. J22R115 TaxID=3053509 RepID=UPI002575D062|nr:LexA family transcriptional regulator [Variovorax sp. J22R115]MDM0053832.1 S24 family peptidase [Variovorax sp. J22R115]